MIEKIIQYTPAYKAIVEDFLMTAVLEGSAGTYKKEKFNLPKTSSNNNVLQSKTSSS